MNSKNTLSLSIAAALALSTGCAHGTARRIASPQAPFPNHFQFGNPGNQGPGPTVIGDCRTDLFRQVSFDPPVPPGFPPNPNSMPSNGSIGVAKLLQLDDPFCRGRFVTNLYVFAQITTPSFSVNSQEFAFPGFPETSEPRWYTIPGLNGQPFGQLGFDLQSLQLHGLIAPGSQVLAVRADLSGPFIPVPAPPPPPKAACALKNEISFDPEKGHVDKDGKDSLSVGFECEDFRSVRIEANGPDTSGEKCQMKELELKFADGSSFKKNSELKNGDHDEWSFGPKRVLKINTRIHSGDDKGKHSCSFRVTLKR